MDNNHDESCIEGAGAWGCSWNPVIGVSRTGSVLQVAGLAASDLQGTPFAAGNNNNLDPTSVTLNRFTMEATDAGVQLAWETALENDVSGFFVQRRVGEAWVRISDFIAAEGDGATGWQYAYIDTQGNAESAYRLEVVNADQSSEFFLPMLVEEDRAPIEEEEPDAQTDNQVYLPLIAR